MRLIGRRRFIRFVVGIVVEVQSEAEAWNRWILLEVCSLWVMVGSGFSDEILDELLHVNVALQTQNPFRSLDP